jgi:tryptophan-rich sensory protein
VSVKRFDWIWFAVAALTAAALGGLFAPGAWFAALHKPSWNPPGWLFGPVWTVLYVMIALAGTLAWRAQPIRKPATTWWVAQMLLNAAWTPMFFGLRQLWPAVVVIAAVWVCIVGFIVTTRREQPRSALLFAPYLVWVSFASALNVSIASMN